MTKELKAISAKLNSIDDLVQALPDEPIGYQLAPPQTIRTCNIDSDRLPDDAEYDWIVNACELAYLQPDELEGDFSTRVRRQLHEAGFDNINFFRPQNVVAVSAFLDDRLYVFIRGSEVKLGDRAARKDTWLDWKRNLQAFGWTLLGGASVHRGIYAELQLLLDDGLRSQIRNTTRPTVISGHSKGGGISRLLSLYIALVTSSRAFVYTMGEMRTFKRGWSLNPWSRPSWVAFYNGMVKGWRISHCADPVSSTPSVLRSCHADQCVQVDDESKREFKTEREMVRARMLYMGEQAGNSAVLAATGGPIAAAWAILKQLHGLFSGIAPKHLMSSYRALSPMEQRRRLRLGRFDAHGSASDSTGVVSPTAERDTRR